MQERREAMMEFERKGADWARASRQRMAEVAGACRRPRPASPSRSSLELIGDEVVERKILSSRLALAIQEKASWELNDLRVRMQYLEGGDELADADVLRPETFSQLLVEQWGSAGLSPESWALIQDVIQRSLTEHVTKAYRLTNEFLVGQGVMRDIDLSSRVKRGVTASGGKKPDAGAAESQPDAKEAGGGGGSLGRLEIAGGMRAGGSRRRLGDGGSGGQGGGGRVRLARGGVRHRAPGRAARAWPTKPA